MNPIDINVNNFESEILESNIPTLVDFWAPWCGPCIIMTPVLEDLAKNSNGKYKIAKVNIEDKNNIPLAQQYIIRSIPNLKIFKNGKIVNEFLGVTDIETLKDALLKA